MPNDRGREGEVPLTVRAQAASAARPWWLGAAIIALGCLCLYGGYQLPQGARHAGIGPGLFVTAVGLGLVVLGLLLTIQIARGESFQPQDAEDASGSEKAHPVAFFTALAAACVPALTIEALGLPITATLSFALVARAFGSRKIVTDLVSGAVLGSLAWFLFSQLGLQLGGFLPVAGF